MSASIVQNRREWIVGAERARTVGRPTRATVSFRTLRRVGFAVLGLQFVALVVWSQIRVHRFALTWDFSYYYQSWWLIAHGDLDPFTTVHGFFFWQNHGEFLMWPFALVGAIWPRPVALLWLQSAGLVAAEAVAYGWICDLAASKMPGTWEAQTWGTLAPGRSNPATPAADQPAAAQPAAAQPTTPQPATHARRLLWPAALALTGLVLLVADPWVYWSVSFDFHFQLVGLVFLLLAARCLVWAPHRLLWLWVVLALLSGDVVATYLAGLGAGAALAQRSVRSRGTLVAAVSVAWVVFLGAVHANLGSELGLGYGYLAAGAGAAAAASAQVDVVQIVWGVVQHPREVLEVVTGRWLDLYAVVAPAGLLGIVSPWACVAVVVVLLENSLNHYLLYLVPGFQDVLVYVLVPIATVDVLIRVGKRAPRLAAVLCALVAAGVTGWGCVWLPRLSSQWLRVSPAAASALATVQQRIPESDEVIAWQGVGGPFSGRRWFYPVLGPATFPVRTQTVWVVVAPAQGIEATSVVAADAFIDKLAGPLGARMVVDRDGIWAFRWTPSKRQRTLVVPAHPTAIAAWSATGPAGRPLTRGPVDRWRALATGAQGYVVAEDYWSEPTGIYRARTVLSTSVAVNVEVWNATGNVLLGRRVVQPTRGAEQSVTFDVDARTQYRANVYGGAGPFLIDPLLPTADNHLEIRVWTPGNASVRVASLGLERIGS